MHMYLEISQGNSPCSYFKQTKISFFFLLQNQRTRGLSRFCLVGERGLVLVGGRRGGERVWEGGCSANTVYTCM
jgi:hypothetical protein